jgi:HSP20 family molecular chaperone IbpA
MDEEPIRTPEAPANPFDRLVRQVERPRSLPAPSLPASGFVFGPPDPVIQDPDGPAPRPAPDVAVMADRIHVTIELPSASRETIEIELSEGTLTVSAPQAGGRPFRQVVPLDEAVEPEPVLVSYRNGVLDVTVTRRPGPSRKEGGDADVG